MDNRKEIRYDAHLQIEAYRFDGVVQAFPNHFHEYFVVGLIEEGERRLTVNNREYPIGPGDLLTFHPLDSHACMQTDGGVLRYLCLNIREEIMREVAGELFGCDDLPQFAAPVHCRTELSAAFLPLHHSVMHNASRLEKEECFLIFMEQLLTGHAVFDRGKAAPAPRREIEDVCAFLQERYAQHITLDMLSAVARLNKYSLVRLFTRCKGITPYRYLETIRIGEARKLLEQGVEPAQVAQRTGFSDQSHFAGYFSKFIGLPPGQYQSIFREGDE